MKTFNFIFLSAVLLPVLVFSQDPGASVRTSIVWQQWSIESVDDAISEITLPIEVLYPLQENVLLQVNHSPAVSSIGDVNMSGLSDTWIRATYSFADNNAMASFGIGLPTGKTGLDSKELILVRWLSEQSFKFQLPVYGQGLTMSGGVMYAYPVNEFLTIGSGLNYVFRGKYKLDKDKPEMDPGDQIGINLGLDYAFNSAMAANLDAVYWYYLADDLGLDNKYTSGPSLILKVGFNYKIDYGTFWANALLHTKAKNELDLITLSETQKYSNRTLRELSFGYKFNLSEKFDMSVMGEGRSYVESKDDPNWVDLFGGGFIGEYAMTENLKLTSGLKLFFGDRYLPIDPNTPTPKLQGLEFYIGSQWNF